jgi:hypothetical protein
MCLHCEKVNEHPNPSNAFAWHYLTLTVHIISEEYNGVHQHIKSPTPATKDTKTRGTWCNIYLTKLNILIPKQNLFVTVDIV